MTLYIYYGGCLIASHVIEEEDIGPLDYLLIWSILDAPMRVFQLLRLDY